MALQLLKYYLFVILMVLLSLIFSYFLIETVTVQPNTIGNIVLVPIGTKTNNTFTKKELLYGVVTIAKKIKFRMLMRSYLQYENPSENYGIDVYFIICRPDNKYFQIIIHENNTYGDMIILLDQKENLNAGKIYGYFAYIASNPYLSNTYKKVGKYDDDTFTYFKNLYYYLIHLPSNDTYFGQCIGKRRNNSPPPRTVRDAYTFNKDSQTTLYMGGCCYGMSMDIIHWITSNKSYAYFHRQIRGEDATTAIWLIKDKKGLNTKCLNKWQCTKNYKYCNEHNEIKWCSMERNNNFSINKNKFIHMHYVKTILEWYKIAKYFYTNFTNELFNNTNITIATKYSKYEYKGLLAQYSATKPQRGNKITLEDNKFYNDNNNNNKYQCGVSFTVSQCVPKGLKHMTNNLINQAVLEAIWRGCKYLFIDETFKLTNTHQFKQYAHINDENMHRYEDYYNISNIKIMKKIPQKKKKKKKKK
eukprot:525166_1